MISIVNALVPSRNRRPKRKPEKARERRATLKGDPRYGFPRDAWANWHERQTL